MSGLADVYLHAPVHRIRTPAWLTGRRLCRRVDDVRNVLLGGARGEGLEKSKTFFGLSLETQRDMVILLVEEHMSRSILEHIAKVAKFDERPGTGIAFQLDVEDAVGVVHQVKELTAAVEEEI